MDGLPEQATSHAAIGVSRSPFAYTPANAQEHQSQQTQHFACAIRHGDALIK
jgi:hypothetical protein